MVPGNAEMITADHQLADIAAIEYTRSFQHRKLDAWMGALSPRLMYSAQHGYSNRREFARSGWKLTKTHMEV